MVNLNSIRKLSIGQGIIERKTVVNVAEFEKQSKIATLTCGFNLLS